MARQMSNRVLALDVLAQKSQLPVLGVFKGIAFKTFKFNADRVVVAIASAPVFGLPGVPGAVIAAHKLPQRAITANVEVRRDFQSANALIVGVCIPIELVGEQALNRIATVLAWGQADGVDHDQVDAGAPWTWPEVGRRQFLGLRVPALLPSCRRAIV